MITSAALITVSVFCAFLLNGDPNIKQFGLGMAAARTEKGPPVAV